MAASAGGGQALSHAGDGRCGEEPAASPLGGWGGRTGWASQARAGSAGAVRFPAWLEDVLGGSVLVGAGISQRPGRGAHQGWAGGQGLPGAGSWAGEAGMGWLR